MNDEQKLHNDALAEQACLGAVMVDNRALHQLVDSGLKGNDFYRPAHETMWDHMLAMQSAGEPIDFLTLTNRLTECGDAARVGGGAYVFTVYESCITAANATYYARIVRDLASRRRLAAAGAKVAQLAASVDGADISALIGAAQSEVGAVADRHHNRVSMSFEDVADEALHAIEAGITCTPTPWAGLNHVIDGWVPGCLYALGARPGVGKTFVSLASAVEFAKVNAADDLVSLYFTFEMTGPRLYQRMLGAESGVDGKRMRQGSLNDEEWQRVSQADGMLRKLPMVVEGASGWTPQQVKARVTSVNRKRKVGFVVVDHIGRTAPDRKMDSRQAELSEAADVCLDIAHEFGAAVLMCTQLNRQSTQRSDQRPVPSDIRDTDRIEQNADVVMLLHRDKDKTPANMDLAVAKNRDGTEALVELDFNGGRVMDRKWRGHR